MSDSSDHPYDDVMQLMVRSEASGSAKPAGTSRRSEATEPVKESSQPIGWRIGDRGGWLILVILVLLPVSCFITFLDGLVGLSWWPAT